MAKGSVTLRGRFSPGSTVRLVKVEGPHVLRPGPHHETVATEKVDDDGALEFGKGVEAGRGTSRSARSTGSRSRCA
jgi:hypothetical protein